MNDAVIQLLVLAAIALFLVIRLKNVLGTRTGFEKPTAIDPARSNDVRREFVSGARQAYEMILMAFENGDLSDVQPFLSEDVYEAFLAGISDREDKGLKVEANFIGVRETSLRSAEIDRDTNEGQITLRFVAELTSVVRDEEGTIVEGNPNEIKKQRDVWTFARKLGTGDPNWKLVATGD